MKDIFSFSMLALLVVVILNFDILKYTQFSSLIAIAFGYFMAIGVFHTSDAIYDFIDRQNKDAK